MGTTSRAFSKRPATAQITSSQLSDGVTMQLMVGTGLCATLGENSGERWATCASALVLSTSRVSAHGPCQASSLLPRKATKFIAMKAATIATESQLSFEVSPLFFWHFFRRSLAYSQTRRFVSHRVYLRCL